MAQSKSTKPVEFDSLVIGSGLAGLIAANQLEASGRKVALLEGLDVLGGGSRPVQSAIGVTDHSLKFCPDTEEARGLLEWLGQAVLGSPIGWTSMDAPPVTYDEGKFKPFIGFGEQRPPSAAEVASFAVERYLRLETTPKDWVPRLVDSFTGTVFTQSFATKMHVDDSFVIDVTVNGTKRISAREILFCASPRQLTRLLPESHVPSRLRHKLVKGEFWTAIHLDLLHRGQVTDSQAVHILKGANEEACAGIFHPAATISGPDQAPQTAQLSQWITLALGEVGDGAEPVASALKQIKRQVKRAYEASLEGLIKERIVVSPSSHGDLSGLLPDHGQWPKIQNLWVISALMSPAKNLVGSLQQARRTLSSVVGDPVAVIEADTDLADGIAIPLT